MKRIKNMRRFLICLLSFLFIGCSIAGGAVLLSNISVSDTTGGGDLSTDENDEVTQNAPTTTSGSWITSGRYADSFAGGSGTEDDPYLIATAAQLARLAYLIYSSNTNNSTYRALYYLQTADINLNRYYWYPIGVSASVSRYFSGVYDGDGYTISNMFVNYSYDNCGMFGAIGFNTNYHPELKL